MTRTADFLYSSGFLRTLAIALPSALLAGIGSAMAQTSAPTVSVFAPRVISEPFIDTAPTFTPDGKTVYFQHSDGVRAAIEVSHLVDGA
jgi:WD40-like Beta Propeller Repeat